MKDNRDFDFIASKFDGENITAPDSLSEDAVKKIIEKSEYKKPIKLSNRKRAARAIVSAVACFAIIIGSASGIYHYNTTFTPKKSNVKDGIVYFDSYKEVERMMKANGKAEGLTFSNRLGISPKFSVNSSTMKEFATEDAEAAGDYSETNVQVDGIDEADIVKTDGKYIYCIDASSSRLTVFSANGEKAKKLTTIGCKDGNEYLNAMFLSGKKLFLIGSTTEKKLAGYVEKCFCRTYDISDIHNPKTVNEYYQSGDFLSARLFNDTVYLVSTYRKYYYNRDDVIPYATDENGNFSKIPYNNYYAIEKSKELSYSVLGAIDVSNDEYKAKSKAVFGTSQDIYCSKNNIYLFGINWNDDYKYTRIIKFSLDKTDLKIKASGRVEGSLIGQYALDESGGNLRVATTSYNLKGDEVNNLFVLDEKLGEIGNVSGFARGESIRAVKYIGDTAYVITFRQTDPLFVIDLKDGKNPKILGEAKVDGFSTLLMPVDDNTLLGVGYSTQNIYYDAVATSGLKLTLFDISDKLNPRAVDEKVYENYMSAAQQDAKALIKNTQKNYFAIPVTDYNEQNGGAYIIRVNNKKISVDIRNTSILPNRLIYIGDYVYAIDKGADSITATKY